MEIASLKALADEERKGLESTFIVSIIWERNPTCNSFLHISLSFLNPSRRTTAMSPDSGQGRTIISVVDP